MPIEAREVRERLLDLFPADTLQEFPEARGAATKAEGIAAVAEAGDLGAIRDFVATSFGRLHQHVRIFERDPGDDRVPSLAAPFGSEPFAERAYGNERHYLYLLPVAYALVLDGPLEWKSLAFAWPLKVVVAPNHVRVHTTIMAKSPQAHVGVGRTVLKATQQPTERELLSEFPGALGLATGGPFDLNRGIKALWEAGDFDAPVVQYKRARATSKDVMDEAFMVKEDDPALYAELGDKPLYQTTLVFMEEDPCIAYVVVNPTEGTLVFRRYSGTVECVDDVIGKILGAN